MLQRILVFGLMMVGWAVAASDRAEPDLLTVEERAWIEAHGPLRYAPDPASPPFEYFRADGQCVGIAIDLLALVERNLEIRIEPVRYPDWSAAMADFKRGNGDFIGPLTITAERQEYLLFTRPVLRVPDALFVNTGANNPKSWPDLAGRRVGVVREYSSYNWLRNNHPKVIPISVATTREGMFMLAFHQLDAMFDSLAVGQYCITEYSLTGVVAIRQDQESVDYHFAVHKENERILHILQKGLSNITEAERQAILAKWMHSQADSPAWQMPPWVTHAFMVAMGVGFGLLLWNLLLRRQVANRTRELQASEAHFRQLYQNAPVAYHSLDAQARILEVNGAWLQMFGYTRKEAVGRPIADFLEPSQLPILMERFLRFKETGTVSGARYVFQKKDRKPIIVSIEGRTDRDSAGNFIRTHCVLHDITALERTQAEVLEVKERLAALFDGAREAILVADVGTGVILDANRAAAALWRCSKEQLIGRRQTALHPAEDQERYRAEFHNLTQEMSVVEGEILTHDGQRIPVEINGNQVSLADGRKIIQGSFRDISQRKQAEGTLAEQERFIAAVAQSSPDYIVVFDLELEKPLYHNRKLSELLGYSESEEQAMDNNVLRNLIHPEDAPAMAAHFGRLARAADREVLSCEYRMRRRGGDYAWFLSRDTPIKRNAAGRVVQFLSVTQEITERKLMEVALRQSHERFQRLFLSSPLAATLTSVADGRFLDVNDRFLEHVGYTREEVLGRTAQEIGLWADWSQRDLLVARVRQEHVVRAMATKLRTKTGRIFDVLLEAQLLDLASGPAILVQAADMTEQKKSQEIRTQLEAQLRQAQKMEAVGLLAGGVAHDFNNILAALLMNLDLLRQEQDASPAIRTGLAEMEPVVQRATALTRQLLLFARREVMQRRVLDLNSLLGNLMKMLNRLIGEHISLSLTAGPQALWVEADPGMLEQVTTNLIVNARDAMPHGGRIDLRTQSVTIDADHAAAHPEARPGDFVCLTVTDTGCGMDEHTRKRIFEPFFTTKAVGKGTGLGLSTVYGIVQQHEGWIEVDSVPAQGSVFRVFLPARDHSQADVTSEAARAVVLRGSETILVVEDEPAVRQFTVRTLERNGYRVLQAGHGQEALRIWEQQGQDVDLLLTDVVMPEGLGGFELAALLHEKQPSLRVIYMSGYNAELMAHGFSLPPGTSFLQKPFAPVDLLRGIRELFD